MDETTFRILDVLAKNLGIQTSIRALAEKIHKRYGAGYYANIYNKLKQMASEDVISIQTVGKTSLINLNFKEYALVDLLSEVDIRKKQELLKKRVGGGGGAELQMLFLELETHCKDLIFVRSISITNATKNFGLNRVELLVLVRGTGLFPDVKELKALYTALHALQSIHNMKIDYLILTDVKLLDMLATNEVNPAKEMMTADRITFYGQQNFWHVIRAGTDAGLSLRASEGETVPGKISETDLTHNLARFGYKEMGIELTSGTDICIEYIITAVMAKGDARRIEAMPIILAKNDDQVNYELMFFLSQKYRLSERLLGLLRALAEIVPDSVKAKAMVEFMDSIRIKEIPADKKAIREKMRLYNAT